MKPTIYFPVLLFIILFYSPVNAASRVFLIQEKGFPYIEAAPVEVSQVEAAVGNQATFSMLSFDQFLSESITGADAVIWPYGSAIYAEIWPKLFTFISEGGNLLVPGGRPFTMEVLKNGEGYTRGNWTNRFIEKLNIIDSEPVSTKDLVTVTSDPAFQFLGSLPNPRPVQAFSMVAMMSSKRLYDRNGSLSTMDGTWQSVLSGVDTDGHNSIPLISQFDRFQEKFVGGRWIFLTFEPQKKFWSTREGKNLLQKIVYQVVNEPVKIEVKPGYAFYSPGERGWFTVEIDKSLLMEKDAVNFHIDVKRNGELVEQINGSSAQISYQLESPLSVGLYTIDVEVNLGSNPITFKQGSFLCGNRNELNAGEFFGTNSHYLTRGEESFLVSGMTYMASDVHRYYFIHPNPVVWDRDMRAMKEAGVNMLRTGIWTGHDFIIDDNNEVNEKVMRAFDAWFMTAKKYDLPVQFCFFHMMPFTVNSKAPYTDKSSFEKQAAFIGAFAERYKDNPDIIWDLINEPSYGREGVFFRDNTPAMELSEKRLWNDWLLKKYKDKQTIARNWNVLLEDIIDKDGLISLPEPHQMNAANLYSEGHKPLMKYDFNLFSQYAYNHWVRKVKEVIRSTGANQMVVTGHDEGGVRNRILNQFYAEESPFVTVHSWWSHDDLLWDNVMGKPQGQPMLVQETGNMRYTGIREHARLSEKELANSLERKIAFGIGANGAGYIPWIWNLNIYMHNENEVFIGLHRGDGTSKKEVKVFEGVSRFMDESQEYFKEPVKRDIWLLAPLSFQMSAYGNLATRATQNAVRALHYHAGLTCEVASEYHLHRSNDLPKLMILPSAHTLTDEAWQKVLSMVDQGMTLLVTGTIDFDPHFQNSSRLVKMFDVEKIEPVIQHQVPFEFDNKKLHLDYYGSTPMARMDRQVWNDPSEIKRVKIGKGEIINTTYPVELNSNLTALAELYKYAADVAGISMSVEEANSNPGILIYPTDFNEAMMYLVVSETDQKEQINLRIDVTGKKYTFSIPPGRAQLLMVNKIDGSIISMYGIDDLQMSNYSADNR